MSRIRANQITNQSADGAPVVQNGLQVTGVVTATSFSGDGSGLINLPSTDSIWRSNSTGINTTTSVGIGTTNTEGYKLKVVGNYRLAGRLDGTATDNTFFASS